MAVKNTLAYFDMATNMPTSMAVKFVQQVRYKIKIFRANGANIFYMGGHYFAKKYENIN